MMRSKTLNEGRRVGHRHRAIIWYREQLIRCHGDSVLVDTVKMGVIRQAQEVELSVRQVFPENYREGTGANLILYIQYTHMHARTHTQSVRGRKVNIVVIH